MKVIGRFNEFPQTEVILYRASIDDIMNLLKHNRNIEKKVQEHRVRKVQYVNRHGKLMTPNPTLRHQIVLSKAVPWILNVKIYSVPMNAKTIRNLKLEPIESVEKKEKTEEALQILTNSVSGNDWIQVTH